MDIASILYFAPGLPLLFILAFLAATVLPIGSEWLLVVLVAKGHPPLEVTAVATAGNVLGACTTYLLGLWGSDFCRRRLLRISPQNLATAERYYQKYGPYSLLLSWLPIIGDPLCFVAGIFQVRFLLFVGPVFIGKFSRYATLAFLTLQGTGG